MEPVKCSCGFVFEGDSLEAQFAVARDHCATTHPEYGLVDQNIRDYIAASHRLSPVRPRLGTLPALVVHPLDASRLEDYLHFFDHEGFAGTPEWAGCYCHYFNTIGTPDVWGIRSAAENRADVIARIHAGTQGGYLAYAGDTVASNTVAGWCRADCFAELPALMRLEALHPEDPSQVGVTACFLIAPPYRRHGVAEALLQAAIEGFRSRGLQFAEGYPRKQADTDAHEFHGPKALYEGAGYAVARETDAYWVMRLAL